MESSLLDVQIVRAFLVFQARTLNLTELYSTPLYFDYFVLFSRYRQLHL